MCLLKSKIFTEHGTQRELFIYVNNLFSFVKYRMLYVIGDQFDINPWSSVGPYDVIERCWSNGLTSVECQAITETNVDWLSIGPYGTHFSENHKVKVHNHISFGLFCDNYLI